MRRPGPDAPDARRRTPGKRPTSRSPSATASPSSASSASTSTPRRHRAGFRLASVRGRRVRPADLRVPAGRLSRTCRPRRPPLRRRATDEILVGAGADEVLDLLAKTFIPPGATAVVPTPTYAMYRVLTEQRPARVDSLPRRRPRTAMRSTSRRCARPAGRRRGLAVRPEQPDRAAGAGRRDRAPPGGTAAMPREGAHAPVVARRGVRRVRRPITGRCARLSAPRHGAHASKAFALPGCGWASRSRVPTLSRRWSRTGRPARSHPVRRGRGRRAARPGPRGRHRRARRARAGVARGRLRRAGWMTYPSVTNFLLVDSGRPRRRRATRAAAAARHRVAHLRAGEPAARPPAVHGADAARTTGSARHSASSARRRAAPLATHPQPRSHGHDDTLGHPLRDRARGAARREPPHARDRHPRPLDLDGHGRPQVAHRHRLLRPPADPVRAPRPLRPRRSRRRATSRSTSTTRSRTSRSSWATRSPRRSATVPASPASGTPSVPMDEAIATAVVDVCGRPYAVLDLAFRGERIGALRRSSSSTRWSRSPDGGHDAPPRGLGPQRPPRRRGRLQGARPGAPRGGRRRIRDAPASPSTKGSLGDRDRRRRLRRRQPGQHRRKRSAPAPRSVMARDATASRTRTRSSCPGVGAGGPAMDRLRRRGLVEPIRAPVAAGGPFLGICLGLQLLFEGSDEDGARMLGLLPAGRSASRKRRACRTSAGTSWPATAPTRSSRDRARCRRPTSCIRTRRSRPAPGTDRSPRRSTGARSSASSPGPGRLPVPPRALRPRRPAAARATSSALAAAGRPP